MPLKPSFKDQLPEKLRVVRILGREVVVADEVAIPRDADLEEVLFDHVARVAAWERAVSKLKRDVATARDELNRVTGEAYVAYWQGLEDQERREMHEHTHDESELRGDTTGRRARRASLRARKGPEAGRWSRNFSNELVSWHAATDDRVTAAKLEVKRLRYELDQAMCMVRAMEHRRMVLNHHAAMHRDTSRQ